MHAEKRHSFKGVSAWIQGQLAGVSRMANKGPVMLGTTTNARQHTPVVNQQRQDRRAVMAFCELLADPEIRDHLQSLGLKMSAG